MAGWRLDHVTNSCTSAGSTDRHDAKLSHATLSHADNAESEGAAARTQQSLVAVTSLRRHARSVAHSDGMAVRRLGHVTRSCESNVSIIRRDAKLSHATLSHADNAESE